MKKRIEFTIPIILLLFLYPACRPGSVVDKKNEVVVRLPSDPGGLNLFLASTGYTAEVCNNIFYPLMAIDPESLELRPLLIKDKPVIDSIEEGPLAGGVTFTFEIIEEARWDDGSPVLASDYLFTYKTLMNPKVPTAAYRAYFSVLRDIRINRDNPRKFSVYTSAPYVLAEAAFSNIEILPEYIYDPAGLMKPFSIADLCEPEKAEKLAQTENGLSEFAELFASQKYAYDKNYISGCGPYSLEEIVPDQRIVLKRKSGWWGDALAAQRPLLFAGPDRIIFKPIPDETTSLSLLKNQEVDAMGSITPDQFILLKKDENLKSTYTFHTPLAMNYVSIVMNSKSPKLLDKRVRRAIAHLTPVDEIIETNLFGLAKRIIGPVHPSQTYYHRDLPFIDFDPEKAKQLLAEAGWEDSNGNGIVDQLIEGQLVEMKLTYRNSSSNQTGNNAGLLLKASARKAGIDLELINQDFRSMIKTYNQRDFELAYLVRRRDPLPDDFKQSWHTSSSVPNGGNRIGFGNARSDAVIDAIQLSMDTEKRNQLYRQFQEIVYDDQACVFLYTMTERVAIHKRFDAKAFTLSPGFFPKYFKLLPVM